MGNQGIYAIRADDGRSYVGSSAALKTRWRWHRARLEAGRHWNAKLQAAWLELGPAAFAFEVLEIVETREALLPAEQAWMDRLRAAEQGFNLSPTAGSTAGVRYGAAVRKRFSESRVGLTAGEKNGNAKLTAEAVLEIRRRLANGEPQRQLARQFELARSVIGRIALRQTWAHI